MPVAFRLRNDPNQPQKLAMLAWVMPDAPKIINYTDCLTSNDVVDVVISKPAYLVDGASFANSLRNMMGFRSDIQYSQAGKTPNSLIHEAAKIIRQACLAKRQYDQIIKGI